MILLKAAFPKHIVRYHQTIPTTMLSIKEDPYPAIHWAKVQTAGIGQYGRVWDSYKGGLYISLRDQINLSSHQLITMAQLAALTVAKVLRKHRCPVRLKWPNDIYLGEKKLGGILIEIESLGGIAYLYTLGIGLNIQPPVHRPDAAGLTECIPCHTNEENLLIECLKHWYEEIERYQQTGIYTYQADWNEIDFLMGRNLAVKTGDEIHQGVGNGIDSHGCLVMTLSSGQQLSFDHQSFIIGFDKQNEGLL